MDRCIRTAPFDLSYIADDDEDIDMSLLELMQSMLELDAIISEEDDIDISLLELPMPHASDETWIYPS